MFGFDPVYRPGLPFVKSPHNYVALSRSWQGGELCETGQGLQTGIHPK